MKKLLSMVMESNKTMYATIKGTLTENDGVFSGFSTTNYLQLQQAIPNLNANSSFEISLKMTMPDVSSTVFVLGDDTGNNNDINIRITTTKQIYGYTYDTTNSNRIYRTIPMSNIQEGDDLYIKYSISGGKLTIKGSSDNINWAESSIDLPSDFAYTKGLLANIGGGVSFFASLSGSIDLNNSYIKLGSTKYNLQAVVGYTIVGSPTIVDGVVSGTDGSNYITLPQYPNIESVGKFELQVKFDATSYSAGIIWSFPAPSSNSYRLQVLSSGTIRYFTPNIYFTLLGLNISSIKYIKLKTSNGLANNVEFYVSSDGLSWTKIIPTQAENSETFTNGIMRLFRCTLSNYDLNETYIKINNKLWFNGQQA